MAASKWKEDPNLQFALQDIHIWEPPQLEPEEELQKQEKLQPKADASAAQIRQETHSEPVAQQLEQSASSETQQPTTSETQQPTTLATQQPTTLETQQTAHPTAQAVAQETDWAKTWKQLQAQNEKLEFRKERNGDWIKMDIKAIRSLPKRNWYLGNNSFLVHGFFNYHYLILGREMDGDKERWYLGVPGFYQQQERVMATIFGFPEFFNSQNGAEPFGYWIHTVEIE